MNRATIRDVAKACNVSIATVSKALNDYADVNATTKENILRVAKDLKYVPNTSARSLGGIPRKTIGLLISSLKQKDESGFVYELISSIYNVCSRRGYEFILLATDSQTQEEMTFLELCRHKDLDGAVVMGLNTDDAYYEQLRESTIPCALMDMGITGNNIRTIGVDNKRASFEAVDYLIKSGHKGIAILNGKFNASVSHERLCGYEEALAKNNMHYRSDYIIYTDFSVDDAHEKAKDLLLSHKCVDAIFCASDLIALGALAAASELNIQVPESLSIIGFDDIFTARYAFGGITTVLQDYYEFGSKAAQCVIDMIEKKDTPGHIVVDHRFIVRNTTP